MIKKLLFSLLALFSVVSTYADEAVMFWDTNDSKVASTVDGFTLTGESLAKGNGSFDIDDIEYRAIKNSDGKQYTITSPSDYKLISNVTFYVTNNDDTKQTSLVELNGSTYSDVVTSQKDYDNPTVISKTLSTAAKSVTFTFKGKQCCFAIAVTYTDTRTVTSQELSGVKHGNQELTPGTDWYLSSYTITLSKSYKTSTTPDDDEYKLVKKITYDNSDIEYVDIDVNGFQLNTGMGYYYSTTAFAPSTAYIVAIPYDSDPQLKFITTSMDVMNMPSYKKLIGTSRLTGANLSDGEYNFELSDADAGISVSPLSFTVKDGKVVTPQYDESGNITGYVDELDVKIYISENEYGTAQSASNVIITAKYSETLAPECAVSFDRLAKGEHLTTPKEISDSYTWDWSKTGASEIKLEDYDTYATSPYEYEEFVLSEISEINNNTDFMSDGIMVACQYPVRNSAFFQGILIKLHTTVAGKVQVIYSNTGNNNGTRYVYVNGEKDTAGSTSSSDTKTSKEFDVAAGTVKITAKQFNTTTGELENDELVMLRITKVIFTADGTAIDEVNGGANANSDAKKVKVMKNGQIVIGNYNIAGQRVK